MTQDKRAKEKIKIGVSLCLLGKEVRYDAGHKRDRFITDVLSEFFEFLPVCPEVDVGMGVPREAVRLVGSADSPQMQGQRTQTDWTARMNRYTARKVKELSRKELSGFILKAKSPSCGMDRVKLYSETGQALQAKTSGLFARRLLADMPHLPVEEEGRLNDQKLRENFIVRVFAYYRLQKLFGRSFSRSEMIAFHAREKYLLRAHSHKHLKTLGQLVARIKQIKPAAFRDEYLQQFMTCLSYQSTIRKNTDVLFHLMGYFKKSLEPIEKKSLVGTIEDYHAGLVPLVAPLTLIKHYVARFDLALLRDQTYLNPHPKELLLRNRV